MARRPRKPDQKATDDLTDLEERLAEVARRSPLSRWVMRNFDRIAALVDEYGPHWGEIAKWMNEARVIGDQTVTGDAVRKAFERERDAKRRRSQADKPKTPPKAQMAASPPAVRVLAENTEPNAENSETSDPLESLRNRMKQS
jgi:hypothetical protein